MSTGFGWTEGVRELLGELWFYLRILAVVVGTWSAVWWLFILIGESAGHS